MADAAARMTASAVVDAVVMSVLEILAVDRGGFAVGHVGGSG